MTTSSKLRTAVAFLAALLLSTAAHAQLFRAYLAPTGNDANPCNLPQPCRLLPAALAAVADGGEIWLLDSANYNTSTVTIGKSVSILAVPGTVGSIVATGGPAISITASGLTVSLQNVVIVPLLGAGGTYGVQMTGASNLSIEDSVLANLTSIAVQVDGTGKVKIANTTFRNLSGVGVELTNGAKGNVSTSRFMNVNGAVAAYGFTGGTTTTASISDSNISGATVGGILVATVASATASAFVTRCTIEGSGTALTSETTGVGTAVIAVSSTMITGNNSAWYQNGAGSVIRTLGNNHITDNPGATTGSLTGVAAL